MSTGVGESKHSEAQLAVRFVRARVRFAGEAGHMEVQVVPGGLSVTPLGDDCSESQVLFAGARPPDDEAALRLVLRCRPPLPRPLPLRTVSSIGFCHKKFTY